VQLKLKIKNSFVKKGCFIFALKFQEMNQKSLFNDIVALPPSQQEDVVNYVSSLKKNVLSSENDAILAELSVENDDLIDYQDYALQTETVIELQHLFEDAPSAEELSEMLSK
jgi:3-dehydroquinate dehydratase